MTIKNVLIGKSAPTPKQSWTNFVWDLNLKKEIKLLVLGKLGSSIRKGLLAINNLSSPPQNHKFKNPTSKLISRLKSFDDNRFFEN